MVFVGGHDVGLAVERTTRRAEDHLAHAVVHARLEEIETADDVDLGVVGGVCDGLRHLRLGGMVVHQLGPKSRDCFFYLRLVAQVDAVNGSRPIHVADLAGAEVVQDGDLMAGRDVRVDHVGTDEAGSASHQDSHGQ